MYRRIKTYGAGGQYLEYIPENGNPIGVILFLHGAGEVVSKGPISIIENHEIPKQLKRTDPVTMAVTNPAGFESQYVILAPQLGGTSWYRAILRSMFPKIDEICNLYGFSEKHCTGLSLGGMGTIGAVNHAYEWNSNQPGYFKSYGIVCGKNTTTPPVDKLAGAVVKWWHGLADLTIPFSTSGAQNYINTLVANGIDAALKTYEGVGHNSWSRAYNTTDPESYWKWLESKFAPTPPPPTEEPGEAIVIGSELYVQTASGRYKVNASLTPEE
jgi:predicted peptidase